MVLESNNFLELDYSLVGKILASSELNIDTENEVFKAADKWLSRNIEERSKFAKSLLLKVRLSLLPDHALRHIINKPSSFSENEDCVTILKQVLSNKENYVSRNSNMIYEHRYCDQVCSCILICGGRHTKSYQVVKEVKQIDGNNFESVKNLSSVKTDITLSKAVILKAELYLFYLNYKNGKNIMAIEKYSPLDDCWSNVNNRYDDRYGYCICSFIDKIYVFGGDLLGSALQFDPNCFSGNK